MTIHFENMAYDQGQFSTSLFSDVTPLGVFDLPLYDRPAKVPKIERELAFDSNSLLQIDRNGYGHVPAHPLDHHNLPLFLPPEQNEREIFRFVEPGHKHDFQHRHHRVQFDAGTGAMGENHNVGALVRYHKDFNLLPLVAFERESFKIPRLDALFNAANHLANYHPVIAKMLTDIDNPAFTGDQLLVRLKQVSDFLIEQEREDYGTTDRRLFDLVWSNPAVNSTFDETHNEAMGKLIGLLTPLASSASRSASYFTYVYLGGSKPSTLLMNLTQTLQSNFKDEREPPTKEVQQAAALEKAQEIEIEDELDESLKPVNLFDQPVEEEKEVDMGEENFGPEDVESGEEGPVEEEEVSRVNEPVAAGPSAVPKDTPQHADIPMNNASMVGPQGAQWVSLDYHYTVTGADLELYTKHLLADDWGLDQRNGLDLLPQILKQQIVDPGSASFRLIEAIAYDEQESMDADTLVSQLQNALQLRSATKILEQLDNAYITLDDIYGLSGDEAYDNLDLPDGLRPQFMKTVKKMLTLNRDRVGDVSQAFHNRVSALVNGDQDAELTRSMSQEERDDWDIGYTAHTYYQDQKGLSNFFPEMVNHHMDEGDLKQDIEDGYIHGHRTTGGNHRDKNGVTSSYEAALHPHFNRVIAEGLQRGPEEEGRTHQQQQEAEESKKSFIENEHQRLRELGIDYAKAFGRSPAMQISPIVLLDDGIPGLEDFVSRGNDPKEKKRLTEYTRVVNFLNSKIKAAKNQGTSREKAHADLKASIPEKMKAVSKRKMVFGEILIHLIYDL
jgi:hypothetical protein